MIFVPCGNSAALFLAVVLPAYNPVVRGSFLFLLSAAMATVALYGTRTAVQYLPPDGPVPVSAGGFWQNARTSGWGSPPICPLITWNGRVEVYLDDRLVPAYFAEDETDAYLGTGLPACKIQALADGTSSRLVAGRASEYWENPTVNHDREFRWLGADAPLNSR